MFWEGLSFGVGFAVAGLIVYMLFILLPNKPPEKIKNYRYWR